MKHIIVFGLLFSLMGSGNKTVDDKIIEYEFAVRRVSELQLLERSANYSYMHPDEFPVWKLLAREIQINRIKGIRK